MEEEEIQTNPLAGLQQQQNTPITSELPPLNKMMVQNMHENLKIKADDNLQYTQNYRNSIGQANIESPLSSFRNDKIKFEDYSIDVGDVYKELNSGNLVAQYESFIPGVDNMERLAQQQTAGDKWSNGVGKFFTKTGTAIVGGTAGVVYGVFDAIKEGSFANVYDNDFTSWLDDMDTKMNYKLPNYYTKQEQDENFFQSLNNANFWASDVLGAASFTVGAIVSEGIWAAATGGSSLAVGAARRVTQAANKLGWGKMAMGAADDVAKGVGKYKAMTKQPLNRAFQTEQLAQNQAISKAKFAEFGNTARFMLTSSGYEAGVEARHYRKEAEENFYRNFQEQNGRQPTGSEIADFESKSLDAANYIFAGNMAVLSVSNAVMFGSLFNIQSPFKSMTKDVNKRLFGIGVEKTVDDVGKTIYKSLTPTKGQKIFSGAFSITKPLATEGIWEEGGQGVMSKTAAHWIESSYNPKYNGQTISMMDAMHTAMGEQFSTKEGWKEMGIGFIIGGGASMIQGGGKPLDLKQIQEARKFQADKVATGYNTFSEDALAKRIIMNNKVQNALEREKKEVAKGDFVKATLANDDVLIAEIEFRHSIGEDVSDLAKSYGIALNNVTVEEWAEQGIEDIDGYKEGVMNAYTDLTKRYKKNAEYAQAVMGVGSLVGNLGQKEQYAQALAYTLTVGENSSKAMDISLSQLKKTIGTANAKSIELQTELKRLDKNTQKRVTTRNNKISSLQQQQQNLVTQLTKLQAAPKETEGDKKGGLQLQKVQEKLLATEEQLGVLLQERETLAQEISKEIGLRQGLDQELGLNPAMITGQDLANIEAQLEKIDNIIESYKEKNPQLYQSLTNQANSYKSAEESFFNYQSAAIALSSGQVRIKSSKMGGLLGKVFNPKGDVDNFTQEFLQDISTNYGSRKIEEGLNLERALKVEVDQAEVVEKIRNGQELSEAEKAYYDANSDAVNEAVNEANKTKGDNPKQKKARAPKVAVAETLESLKSRVEQIVGSTKFPINYEGQNSEEMLKDKPSEEDINQYRKLLRRNKKSAKAQKEFEALQNKLGNWRLYDSITDGELSLADILDLIEQFETQIEEEQVKTDITTEDTVDILDTTVVSDTGSIVVYGLTMNTKGNATVRKGKDSRTGIPTLSFHHIKMQTILGRLGGAFEILDAKQKPLKNQDIEKGTKVGNIFRITPEGSTGSIDFVIGRGGSLVIKEQDFIPLQQTLNLYIVDTGNINWSYKDVYEVRGDSFIERESDFTGDNLNGDTYSLKADEEVELYYDAQDEWNVAQKKLFDKGKITKEQFINSLKIYISKGGQNHQTLKAMVESEADERMMAIREKAFSFAKDEVSTVFGTIKVSEVVLGSPKLNLDENQRPEDLEFTDRAIGVVVATGFIVDNEFTLSDKSLEDTTNQSFVGKVSKKNPGKKIPVVVFKKGAHTVAYAVTLKKEAAPKTAELGNILQDANLTEVEKVKEINALLIETGISPDIYNLTSMTQMDKLQQIEKALAENISFRSPQEMSEAEYDLQNLKADATIQIDLEDLDRAISSPKLRIDLDEHILYEDRPVKYNTMLEMEAQLNILGRELELFVNKDYVDKKGDAIENNFTDVFADRPLFKKPKNNLEEISNINILQEAYSVMPKNAKDMFGQSKSDEVGELLKRYYYIRKQLQPKKDGQHSATENEIKC